MVYERVIEESIKSLRAEDMASLFNVNRPTIVKHINNILNDGELDDSTCSILEKVQFEGERQVKRKIKLYKYQSFFLFLNTYIIFLKDKSSI